jgi:hypothetical protein
LAGASAAQSPLLASLDAGLGVQHSGRAGQFLQDCLAYMNPAHAAFVRELQATSRLRAFCVSDAASPACKSGYNACLDALQGFRRAHLLVVKAFVLHPDGDVSNSSHTPGTSGLPVMALLLPPMRDTRDARVLAPVSAIDLS